MFQRNVTACPGVAVAGEAVNEMSLNSEAHKIALSSISDVQGITKVLMVI
jgi:hypothetical protein